MPDSAQRPSRSRRTRRSVLSAVSVLAAGALATGTWLVVADSDDGPADCGRLVEQQRMRTALGDRAPKGPECKELGSAIVAVTGGDAPGPRTAEQAGAMKNVVLAVESAAGRDGGAVPAPLRRPLGQALQGYAGDLYEILHGLNPAYVNTAAVPSSGPWEDGTGAHFAVPADTALRAVRAVSDGPAEYAALRSALDDEGVRRFAALAEDARGSATTAVAATDARVTGALAGVADQVAEGASGGADRWYGEVFAALTEGDRQVPSAASDIGGHLTGSWKSSLRAAAEPDRADLLLQRSERLFVLWADARKVPAPERDATLLNCRKNAQGAFEDAVAALSGD
ncbi:hypothetical protein [Streptomyces griseus]